MNFLEKIANKFNHLKIPYAVVGGYAVALHGAIRGTIDVDLIIEISLSSFEMAEKALMSMGLKSRLPVDARNVFEFRNEYINNRNFLSLTLENLKWRNTGQN